MRQKLPVKQQSTSFMEDLEMFGNKQTVPENIKKELEKKGLVARFISTKKFNDAGGVNEKGWIPYVLDTPTVNIVNGTTEKTFKVGDLVLAVKSKEDHAKHLRYLQARSAVQSGSVKEQINAIRDNIRSSKADGQIKLTEGYEENE